MKHFFLKKLQLTINTVLFLLLLFTLLLISNPAFADTFDSSSVACISFRALINYATSSLDLRANSENPFDNMGGITSFDGYVVDTTNHDIVIIGTTSPKQPTLHLDDFATLLRNAWTNDTPPFCSLDPNSSDLRKMHEILNRRSNPENDEHWLEQIESDLTEIKINWHAQKVILKGVPRNSHTAKIMLDADFHMKRVTLGLISVPMVTSYLDRFIEFNRTETIMASMHNAPFSAARFWFHMHSFDPQDSTAVPFPRFQKSSSIVVLENCDVVLLTEKRITGENGAMVGVPEKDSLANGFAKEFSNQYQNLIEIQPSYAALEQLFRLNALIRAMLLWNVFDQMELSPDVFLNSYQQQTSHVVPDTMPGLVNFVKMEKAFRVDDKLYVYVQFPIAYGGVDMDFPVTKKQFLEDRKSQLDSMLKKILDMRPSGNATIWHIGKKKIKRNIMQTE